MATKVVVTFEKISEEGDVDILLNYSAETPAGMQQGTFREHFNEEGLRLLRRDFESLPGQKQIEWASPKATIPFPPTIKLFVRKALGLL
ncbi:MAG: hypothetical protein HYX24_02115 [Candidatus Aenigmarchaeota archaeon]|nr:hypothetical protein [Candidatus Aenigmarchaeota archaeon]